LAIKIFHLCLSKLSLGTFEIVVLYIQFSKNSLGLRPEHKAQS